MLSRLDVALAPDIDGGLRGSVRRAQYATLQAALVLAATVANAGWGVRTSSVGASSDVAGAALRGTRSLCAVCGK